MLYGYIDVSHVIHVATSTFHLLLASALSCISRVQSGDFFTPDEEPLTCRWGPKGGLLLLPNAFQMVLLWVSRNMCAWGRNLGMIWVTYIRSVVPEAGLKCKDKQLHPTVSVGCNQLSLPLLPASGTQILIYWIGVSDAESLSNFWSQTKPQLKACCLYTRKCDTMKTHCRRAHQGPLLLTWFNFNPIMGK